MRKRFGLQVGAWVLLAGFAFGQGPPDDPDIRPAQFTTPTVADPPTPVVRIQVRVPANIAPGKDIAYKLIVTNTSTAHAYRVKVRNPIPEGIARIVKYEPEVEKIPLEQTAQMPKELVWDLGKLPAGEKREIDLVLQPIPTAKDIRNQAFVSFEHGQTVETHVDKPKLMVKKVAPKQAAQSEAIPVRVEVTNNGKVSIENVKLVEVVSRGFEFVAETSGERGETAQQRVWTLGTLRPGERKLVEYRLTTKEMGTSVELLTRSQVHGKGAEDGDSAESTTKVLNSGVSLELTGPTAVGVGDRGDYEIVVRNTGGMTLSNLKVTGTYPADCTLVRVTNNSQRDREQVSWLVPPLKSGESFAFRFSLKAAMSGKRTIRAAVTDGRAIEKGREAVTTFQGTALPQLSAQLTPALLKVDQSGMLTIVVTNKGTETAKNVRVWVTLPPEVRLVEATPKNVTTTQEVAFDAVAIKANGEEKFTVTYKAAKPGEAWFDLKLTADALGDQPATKKLTVQINP